MVLLLDAKCLMPLDVMCDVLLSVALSAWLSRHTPSKVVSLRCPFVTACIPQSLKTSLRLR